MAGEQGTSRTCLVRLPEALKRDVELSLCLGEREHYVSRVSNSNADDVKQHTDFENLQENGEVHPFTMINSALSL